MGFMITALAAETFEKFFEMTEAELAQNLARRVIADATPGYPCRVSLQDAEVGEELLLLNHQHQPARTPYQASHAIFVRRGALQARPGKNEIPPSLRPRLLSLRGFTQAGMLSSADVVPGLELCGALERLFQDAAVSYVHIHNAKQGCYHACAIRA